YHSTFYRQKTKSVMSGQICVMSGKLTVYHTFLTTRLKTLCNKKATIQFFFFSWYCSILHHAIYHFFSKSPQHYLRRNFSASSGNSG
ncbi:MAG: hypothetical protein PUG66_08820, partial [Clostridiales bacterium]|nr:hypothetical protein [Clostridiales bacterium]